MIASGQTILAGDFISTSAGAGDSGKVPKLNASGQIDSSFISSQTPLERLVSSFTADEAISAKSAVYLSDGTGTSTNISSGTGVGEGFTSATTWLAQTFVVSSGINFISGIGFRANNNYCSTVTASIRATSGGLPTGADIGGITGQVVCGSSGAYSITFSSPVPVTPGSTYAMVFRTSNTSGSPNWGYLDRSNTSPYANGKLCTSGDSGGSWAGNGSGYDLYSSFVEVRARAGKIGLANDGSDQRAKNFIGFAEALIAKDGTGKVILSGYVSGLTGMTAGVTAYLGTDGAVGASGTKKIGLAISSTEMLIKHDNA